MEEANKLRLIRVYPGTTWHTVDDALEIPLMHTTVLRVVCDSREPATERTLCSVHDACRDPERFPHMYPFGNRWRRPCARVDGDGVVHCDSSGAGGSGLGALLKAAGYAGKYSYSGCCSMALHPAPQHPLQYVLAAVAVHPRDGDRQVARVLWPPMQRWEWDDDAARRVVPVMGQVAAAQ